MSPFGWRAKGIKVCPNCGSTDILSNTYTGYITQPIFVCNKCGYQNTIFPEVEIDGLKKTDEVDNDLKCIEDDDSQVADKEVEEKKDRE